MIKTLIADDIFKFIDESAEFLYKDSDSETIFWSSDKPEYHVGSTTWSNTSSAKKSYNGSLGNILVEEFKGKPWWECLYRKNYGLVENSYEYNLEEEIKFLKDKVKTMEDKVKSLEDKLTNHIFESNLDYYKGYRYPDVTLCNKELK